MTKIVNVTYDDGQPLFVCSSSFPRLTFRPLTAGSVTWFDPDAQKTFVYNNGDIAWTLASTALVWIMIPGVGFFYSGLLRRKNALSMIYLSMMTIAVVSFQVRINCFFHFE
jgi:hypothetical protein